MAPAHVPRAIVLMGDSIPLQSSSFRCRKPPFGSHHLDPMISKPHS